MKPLTLFARRAVLLRPITRPTIATTTTTQAASQLLLHLRQTPFSTAARALLQRNTNRITQHLPVLLRRLRSRKPLFRRYSTPAPRTTYNPTPSLGSPEPALSLSQRMKKLSREYGWSALGVYLALSALDFPFCFLAVRLLGTDRIGRWEHAVVQALKDVAGMVWPQVVEDKVGDAVQVVQERVEGDEQGAGWGVEEAEKRNNSNASEFFHCVGKFRDRSANYGVTSSVDAIGARVCHSQILYLPAGALDGGRDAKGGKGVAGMGLEYWKEKAEDATDERWGVNLNITTDIPPLASLGKAHHRWNMIYYFFVYSSQPMLNVQKDKEEIYGYIERETMPFMSGFHNAVLCNDTEREKREMYM